MIRLQYIGIKADSVPFRVVNSKLLKADCDKLPKGRYRLIVEKLRKNKSNPQLAWLYGQIYPHILQGYIDLGWEDITSLDQVDAKMKSMFANTEIINKHTGEVMAIPLLKRNMSTVEFSTYTDSIRDFAREWLNVEIPDPEQNYEMDLK